jgi:hypothetical protein
MGKIGKKIQKAGEEIRDIGLVFSIKDFLKNKRPKAENRRGVFLISEITFYKKEAPTSKPMRVRGLGVLTVNADFPNLFSIAFEGNSLYLNHAANFFVIGDCDPNCFVEGLFCWTKGFIIIFFCHTSFSSSP